MKRIVVLAIPALVSGVAACGGDPGGNARKLFLAPDGSEIKLHLIESEPRPF